jgi:hypothetical protein
LILNVFAVIVAQRLVDEFAHGHPELAGLQLSVVANGGCRTIAATAREQVGEICDVDELGPIRTGKPAIEMPTRKDPVYDVTQALHDAGGRLVGAAGMDLRPSVGANRDAILRHARTLLRELESRIPSKEKILQPAER